MNLNSKFLRPYVPVGHKVGATPPLSLITNPNFQRWFGSSKVVDEQGNPTVVYRGDYRADRVGDTFKVNRSKAGRFFFYRRPRHRVFLCRGQA